MFRHYYYYYYYYYYYHYYYYYYYYHFNYYYTVLASFSRQCQLLVFHWRLSDKSPQASWNLLNLLADLYNSMIRMILILTPISTPYTLQDKLLAIIPSALTTIGITVSLMFYSCCFFSAVWQCPIICLFFRFLLFSSELILFARSQMVSSIAIYCLPAVKSFLLFQSDLTDKMKRSFFQAAVSSILLYGFTTWTLTKRLEKKLDGNYTRILRATLNKSWRQHPTRHQLYGHLPPITKTIQVRRARHAGHGWRSRHELISDVLLWTPTYGRAKAGRPARTYILQLCEDTGCSPEDLSEAMNDREKWRERVRDICASGTP